MANFGLGAQRDTFSIARGVFVKSKCLYKQIIAKIEIKMLFFTKNER